MATSRNTRPLSILVAGGAGYVGSRLVPALIEAGHRVTVVDLLWFGNHLDKKVKVVKRDILELTPKFLEGFDQVIFLAGLSNDPMANLSPSLNYVHNVAAPAHLAHIAKEAGVARYIYAESCAVYGYTAGSLSREHHPTVCHYPYGISKLCGGLAISSLADKKFSVIRLRMGTVCGYSPRMRFDLLVNTLYQSAMTQGKITVNNPRIWRPVLAIEDAVTAYMRAVTAPKGTSGIFNVSSGNYTVGEIAEATAEHIKRVHGRAVKLAVNDIKDVRNYRVSTKRAEKELNFKPKGTPASILKELDVHIGPDFPFHRDHFYNIRTFRKLLER